MEPSPNLDYAIKELSSLNIELQQKAANLKKKEKNFLQITDQWKEYIDNYIKTETIQMEDQIKLNKINQLMSRLNAQRSLLATVSSLKMHIEELRVYNENKDNEIDNLKSQIKTLTQTNKSLNKKLEIQKWKQEKAAAEYEEQIQQSKKTPSSSIKTNKKKMSSSSLNQSQTHSYRLIEGLLYCIKPEKLSVNNYLSLPTLLPSLTFYLPHIFTQTKSFQIVFCKFLYYYIYYMNMKEKLNHMHIQKFLDTIFSSPTPLEDDKSPSIIVYCLMVCILSKDPTQLNTVLSIIQAKLFDNDFKDIYNKYNGTNIIIPLITSNNKSVNHNILTILLLFAQEPVPTSLNNNNNSNNSKNNQINISFYNTICSEQFFNICVEVYSNNKYTIETEEVLALCLQRLSSSPLYLNKLKDELYLINSLKLRLKNLNGDISDFLKLNLQSFLENITLYQSSIKQQQEEENNNNNNIEKDEITTPNTSKSSSNCYYSPYTPSKNVYPSPKPVSPMPSTPSPTLEKVQSLLDTVRQLRTQMTPPPPPTDESMKDISIIEGEEDEEKGENDDNYVSSIIKNDENDSNEDEDEDTME